MGVVFESLLLDLVGFATLLVSLAYLYFTRHFKYWEKKGVVYPRPTPFIGNCRDLFFLRCSPGEFVANIYNEGKGKPYIGYFIADRPALVVRDPELIKNIMIKDFAYFSDRHTSSNEKVDPLGSRNLLLLKGARWKHLRTKLSPAFTLGKMKLMFNLIDEVGIEMSNVIHNTLSEPINVKELTARYSTDVISTCAFGVNSNALSDPNSEFREFGRKVFDFTVYRAMEVIGFFFIPSLVRIGAFSFFQTETSIFLRRVFWDMIHFREKNRVTRNDFIDLLIEIKNKGSIGEEESERTQPKDEKGNPLFDFNGDDLVAQAAIFFTAGFETTATTISFTLYELALQPEVQQRLREQIQEALKTTGGKMSYDLINSMKYLDMVVSETLRKYPPFPFLDRICVKDYTVPDSKMIIEKDTPVYISAYGIHHDPEIYPNPQHYDPERFSDEEKKSRPPCTHLPFGDGPHVCIGMRFGLMTAKLGIVHTISRFEVGVCKDTPIPVVLNPNAIILATIGGIPLDFKSIA